MATKKRKGRGDPKGPAKRGIRGHRVVDQYAGLAELIDSMLQKKPRPTYAEMADRLRHSGFNVARSTLARYGYEFEITRRKVRMLAMKAKALAADNPSGILEVERAIAQVANTILLDNLLDPDGNPISDDARETITAAARLQSSSASRERARLLENRGVRKAMLQIKANARERFGKKPELLAAIFAILDESALEVSE